MLDFMKTSLNIEESLYKAARGEALRTGRPMSEIISRWAAAGRKALLKEVKGGKRTLNSVDLGGPSQIDLSSRRDWYDSLEE